MANEERDKRLDRARLRVLFQMPFFASGVARLPVVWDPNVETCTTDGDKIMWNPEYFDSLKDEEIPTLYCEEVSHCMLGHPWRKPAGAAEGPGKPWSKACDAAVRGMLSDFSDIQKAKGYADPFPFPDPDTQVKPYRPYFGMAEEKIYRILAALPGSGENDGQNPPGGGGGSGKGKGKGNDKSPPGDSFAEFQQPGNSSPQQRQKNDHDERDWKNCLLQSAAIGKNRGEVPGNLLRMIGEMLHPEIPWQDVLRQHLREIANDDWNFMKPEIALSDATGFVMPSLDSERVGEVVFAIDTSGSIDNELLKQFKSEAQYCLDDMHPSALVEICCDSSIHRVKEYRKGEQIDNKAPGGGGTDFRPVFDHLEERPVPPKCVVYLTDLDGTFPKEEPPYPVIWIAYGTDKQAPFGTTIKVK